MFINGFVTYKFWTNYGDTMLGGKVRIIFKFLLIRMIKVINIHKNLISLQDDARLKHKIDLLLTS